MAEPAPERITDLLKDDDFIYDEDEQAVDMDADKPDTPRAAPQAAQQQQQQQQQVPAASKQRVPIPAPAKRTGPAAPEPGAAAPAANGGADTRPEQPTGAASLPPAEACRYFIIKSNSEYNIKLSVQTGVWSTKVRGPHCSPLHTLPDAPAALDSPSSRPVSGAASAPADLHRQTWSLLSRLHPSVGASPCRLASGTSERCGVCLALG